MKTRLEVPVYNATVWIVAAKDLHRERCKFNGKFGEAGEDDYDALCSSNGTGTFGLFFRPRPSLEVVSHEVFHLTHRILEWVEAPLDADHHEHAALLHGYLMREVWNRIKKAG